MSIDNTPLFLIKITKKQYAESTINTHNFHFTHASYFRKYESANNNIVIGDVDEGSYPSHLAMYIKLPNHENYQLLHRTGVTNTHVSTNNNECIYCTYSIFENDFIYDKNKNIYYHNIQWDILNKIIDGDDPNNYAILIIGSVPLFLDSCKKSLDKLGRFFQCGIVSYDNHNFDSSFDDSSLSHYYFHKKDLYSYQKEFRIVTFNNKNDHLLVNIEHKELFQMPIIMNKGIQFTLKIKQNEYYYTPNYL